MLVIEIEKVRDVWEELDALGAAEYIEVEDERRRVPDWDSMKALNSAGIFQVLTARVDGRMVGYFSWLIDFDMESKGTLIVNQTAWYVEPGHPIIGVKMFDRAIEEFKRVGVEFAYLHHTVHGRGASIGRLFTKRGAELLGHTYKLKVKGNAELP
jgi:hypothetical protein